MLLTAADHEMIAALDFLRHNIHVVSVLSFDPLTGYLPPGEHRLTWEPFVAAFAWNGRRRLLCGGLQRALKNLGSAGCRSVIVDGSYVTARDQPGDYDAAFDPVGVDGARVDAVLLRHDDGRRAMKAKYLGEIFPWGVVACGTTGALYREFFRRDRSGAEKGVVILDPRHLP